MKGKKMIEILAIGLENHNPFVYLFFIILFEPPVVLIIYSIIEKILKTNKEN
jgi:hypothetical protein